MPDGLPTAKVLSVTFTWTLREGLTETVSFRSEPDVVVRDALDGTLLFIDSDGLVTGDVETALGRMRK